MSARPAPAALAGRERAVYLLDRDPDLGRLLAPPRAAAARAAVRAPVATIARGPWVRAEATAGKSILVLDGLLLREVLIADDSAAEVLGPGDLVDVSADGYRLLPSAVRWTALARAEIAVLDPEFARTLVAFPEIALALMGRQRERAERLAALQAIAHLVGIHRRLLALLWLLADRWGVMTKEGIALPLALRHSVMAFLVGARRPTVSAAMSRLQRRGAVLPRPGGGWILREQPEGVHGDRLTQVPRPRGGPVLVAGVEPSADGSRDGRGNTLEERVSRAQAESLLRLQELVSTQAQTRASRDDVRARREARLAARDGARSAAKL